MKQVYFIIILMVWSISLFGQSIEEEANQLRNKIKTAATDNEKINYYLQLSSLHHNYQPAKSIEYAQQALVLSQKKKDTKKIAEAYGFLFNGHYFHGSNADSLFKYVQLFENQLIANKDTVGMIKAYWGYSMYYGNIGMPDKDIEYSLKALDFVRKYAPSKDKEARLLNNIGAVLQFTEQYRDALKYYRQALLLVDQKIAKGNIKQNIGVIYRDFMGKIDSAQFFFDDALLLYKEAEDFGGIVAILSYKGQYYDKLKQYKKAEQLYFEALELVEKNDIRFILLELYTYMAQHFFDLEKFYLAIEYGEKALEETLLQENYNITARKTYSLLHESYAITGQFQKAYKIQHDLMVLKDSISNTTLLSRVETLKTEYEVEKKEIENKLFKTETQSKLKQQQLYIILGVVIIFFLMLGTFFFLKQNESLERKVQERSEELITANQKIEAFRAIKLLEEAKSRFFANISHEFRTPLTLIQAPIETVLNNESLSHHSQAMLKRALSNSKQLLILISQILDLSKLDDNKLALNEKPTILYILIRRIIANFETYTQQKGITLKLEYQLNADLQIEIDTDKVEKILSNYLSNAVKFTPKEGMITVIVSDFKNRLQIAVQDTGRGIPSDELEFVFNRFYQVKDNHYEGGTGIGLSLCKDYAALLKGTVWAVSPNKNGKGSTFYFEFPKKEIFAAIADEKAYQIERLKDTLNTTQISDSRRKVIHHKEANLSSILLVEDNHDLRDFLIELLEDQYQVVAVENGKVALEMLETVSFDLIISDVMMPIMDGFELLENLKSNGNYRHIPVMMLTARAEFKDKIKALRIGVDDYMLKPFNEEELKARVSNLILNFNSRQEVIAIEKEKADLVELPKDIKYSKEDKDWLIELEKQVEKNLSEIDFSVEQLASELYTSRSQLYRKIKLLTGLSTQQYIKEARLQKARFLLETNTTTSVKETSYQVGFKHTNYFSQSFEKRFGKRPSAYLE
ncbi:MAG: response regulator [Saprospiraceae bacterium]